MKRRAYTLAETLLALTIVGALSVLSFTAVNKFKPDTNKIMYLKMHDEILTAVSDIAASYETTTIDTDGDGDDDLDISEYPLLNTANDNDGQASFIGLMQEAFSGTTSGDGFVTSINNIYMEIKSNVENYTFENVDGNLPQFYYIIKMDINGSSKEPNCSYVASTCPEPDTFIFYVLPSAKVVVGDSYGRAYLENRQVQNINASILKDREKKIKSYKVLCANDLMNENRVRWDDIKINTKTDE